MTTRVTRRTTGLALLAALLGAPHATAQAAETLRIANQFGISYLPLHMLREHALIEKHGREQGVEITVEWLRFSSGATMNDGIISGSLDIASGGIGPLLTLWDKTRGNLDVRAIAAINDMPLFLTTRNPNVRTVKDFTAADKIALPAVKVSIQARTLQMAAEQAGLAFDALDGFTVSMPHPDATAAILSGGTEITGHFSSPPFQYQQLENPAVRRVLSSYEVLGGPATFNVVWATQKLRTERPKVHAAFLAALREAIAMIDSDHAAAAAVYIKQENSKLDPAFVKAILDDPDNRFTIVPHNTMKYAEFMHRVGALNNKPAGWQDYFFPEIHDLAGS
jgi:NitT/TauT family transport system substrate-binding protein